MSDSTTRQSSEVKTCTRCGVEKPLEEYHRRSDSADGRKSHCKACEAERGRAWRIANRERKAETDRAYYAANKERKTETSRAWYEANRERILETTRAWYEANRERAIETDRAWKKANPEKVAQYQARRRAKHPDRVAARMVVNNAVRCGKLAAPRDLPCSTCGAPAEEYHHHLGYAPEHALDVIPVCRVCHVELDRGQI